jgi:hypothetical protein
MRDLHAVLRRYGCGTLLSVEWSPRQERDNAAEVLEDRLLLGKRYGDSVADFA